MWVLDCEESWAPKNWCFWTMVLERTLGTPLDCKEIQPVHPKGDQSWVFIGRTDAKAETPVVWPSYVKCWLIGKDPNAGRDWGQEEKGMTEDKMAGWHHWLDGHEFVWTLGVGDGQGGLACYDSRGRKQSDMSERLNWTECKLPCDYYNQMNFWTDRKITLLYVYLSLSPCVCVYLFTNNLHINCSSVVQSSQLKKARLPCPSLSPRVCSN